MERKNILRSLCILILAGTIIVTATLKQPRVSTGAGTFEANMHPPADISSILHRACYDCHSNETRWPWYSRVPPMSWMMRGDVENARHVVNFSEWSTQAGKTPELGASMLMAACAAVESGQMPKKTYLLMHPEARLSNSDRKRFCEWTYTFSRELSAQSH